MKFEKRVGFKFTIDKNGVADQKILSDLNVIKELLLNNLDNLRSLILVGGFGRGEGSMLMKNGEPEPVNDYDIVLVAEKKHVPPSGLKELSEEIAKKIGIRLVDLIPIEAKQLSQLPFTMFNYDMKYGGYVFWGNEDVLAEMPDYNPAEMPLIEAKILLFNRMICLLESYSEEFRTRQPSDDERFFLVNQSGKVILACCDALLVLKGLYHHSYAERCRRFSRAFKDRKEYVALVQKATDFKLRPTRDIECDLVRYWFDARKMFMETLFEFFEAYYGRPFDDVSSFNKFYTNEGVPFYNRIGNALGLRKSVNRSKNIELLELALIAAVNEESYADKYLRFAGSMIRKISGGEDPHNKGWEWMRKECVNLWFRYLH